MTMDEPRTELTAFQKDFPFESRLSLGLLIRFWEEQAQESSLRGDYARSLLARLRETPELMRPSTTSPCSISTAPSWTR